MPYKDQIIKLSGGLNEWIGELQQGPHKMGKNWYRLKNPCFLMQMPDGKVTINAIQGDLDHFKRFVDIRIPEESIIEITVVDPNGTTYEAYQRQIKRKKSNLILAADDANLKLA